MRRRLGTGDAVTVGLGAMLGAGVFAAFGPAARSARELLPVALGIAAVVAYCNATSSARLAARHPQSGGTYVYGRERLGPFWGYLAGWTFVVGKTASCAAMAMTFAAYVAPGWERPAGMAAVLVLTWLNWQGVQRSAAVSRVIVAIVLAVLLAVVVAALAGPGHPDAAPASVAAPTPGGVLQAAGLLFFAFAGYARIATLGEEVRDPARTIPRAVTIALGAVLLTYAAVCFALLAALGPGGLAASATPVADAAAASGASWLVPVVRAAAALAALGALLALILGVSRTALAMARDGFLPRRLAAVHPRHQVPHVAELAVGLIVVALVATVDLRGAIGFSSFGVLLYYAIANAAALTLSRVVPITGLVGCLVLAFALPWRSVLTGAAVVLAGALAYALTRRGGDRPER
ncbi:amino acid/polyamine/organocation transporter (APC superfamily) [Actinoplanes teichomyceticus]|uniref:Amino acid/polyamine/organocation transporter (APC superfamily) n=1 Tax=Actinoplanes teichomyceticus TaxID=1867 RepID=A0A561WLV6_ACTTI|nr:amino acid/polyamine/organocation transporter (APC superfamily) [Actinoplanes teichomyceticus]